PRAISTVLPAVVHTARKIALRRGVPAHQLPGVVRRVARVALRSPKMLRRFQVIGSRLRGARRGWRIGGYGGYRRWARPRWGWRGYGPSSSASQTYAPTWGGPGGGAWSPEADYAPSSAGPRWWRGPGGGAGAPASARYGGTGWGSEPRGWGGATCPNCRSRTIQLRGPVTLTIQSP